ncbi:cell division protein FtsL [Roseococcus suduntuyensis]|uniref:Cell division protein FtsL n=1 Tax=Roseococcus suduntuyensis TaxID=455361 RepID=A0A840ADA1_9PROT|nr:hypothetical protein [Roseococcus suduntuyensis]MBB3898463.1 hypothetical protein [Roseococcus suduntuyensis]
MLIRPLAFLGCLAFLGTGFHVYSIKAEVDAVEAELRRTLQATEAERVQTRTLSAEWARLTDQDRLQALASAHLPDLVPTTPQQFLRVADAGRRLPAPADFAGGPSAFRTRTDVAAGPGEVLVFSARTMVADARPAATFADARPAATFSDARPAATFSDARPAVVSDAPVTPVAIPTAVSGPAPQPVAAAPVVAALAVPTPVIAPTPRATPVAARPPEPRRAPEPRPAPRLAEAPVRPAPAPRDVAAARPAADPALRTAMHVRAAPMAPPMPQAGSMLGGGVSLPPPVPFGR